MAATRNSSWIVVMSAALTAGVPARASAQLFTIDRADAWGPNYTAARRTSATLLRARSDKVRRWNEIALNANALDHTPLAPDDGREGWREQLGPARTSRAFAIVHIAIFDAVNAIAGGYRSYTGIDPAPPGTSMDAAIAQAARDTLAALFPSQRVSFDDWLAEDLGQIPDRPSKVHGIDLGHRAASAILLARTNDGSQVPDPCVRPDASHNTSFCKDRGYVTTSDAPGKWRQDPISEIPLAIGAYWGGVRPFALPSDLSQFGLPPPPPPMTSDEYVLAFAEAKRLGGDGIVTPTDRTPEQTQIGIFWAYDGTPGLGTPPRLFNQITVAIADQRRSSAVELARLLALVNVGMADVAIATWRSKYDYQVWRPITGIRLADEDGNDQTLADPAFTPLGAPASNLSGPNFTPPFPAYSSGHAGLGGAVFRTLRNFYGTDDIAFSFVSDELNGETRDNAGNPRPKVTRSFSSLSQAADENGQSRIYLGVHWAFDKSRGIDLGRRVADWIFYNAFLATSGN